MKTVVFGVLVILALVFNECLSRERPFRCGQRPLKQFKENDMNYSKNNTLLSEIEPSGKAASGQWPWYGLVYHMRPNRKPEFLCGCTLISQKHVLIQENECVLDDSGAWLNSSSIFIRFGTHHQNVLNLGFARFRKVRKIHVPFNELIIGMGILELDVKIKFNDYVQPIRIVSNWMHVRKHTRLNWRKKGKGHLVYDNERIYTNHMPVVQYTKSAWYIINYIIYIKRSVDEANKQIMVMIIISHASFWIEKITDLHYLPKRRDGQNFDPAKQYPQLLPKRHCGRGLIEGENPSHNVSLYETPWLVQLHATINDLTAEHICTGSLINHRYVLTHTACVVFFHIIFVRLGEYNVHTNPDCNPDDSKSCAPYVRDYEVDYAVFDNNDSSISNVNIVSITLIRTKEKIAYEDHIQPICLPLSSSHGQMDQSQYSVTFWKYDDKMLHKVTIDTPNCQKGHYNNTLSCSSDYIFPITPQLFGAPAVSTVDSHGERFVQLAMVYTSDNDTISLLNILPFIDWIIANVNEEG